VMRIAVLVPFFLSLLLSMMKVILLIRGMRRFIILKIRFELIFSLFFLHFFCQDRECGKMSDWIEYVFKPNEGGLDKNEF